MASRRHAESLGGGSGIRSIQVRLSMTILKYLPKLLGHPEANDIDIALSDMMGLSFAEHLAVFAKSKGIETGTIAKIAQNPDQSKHLETATFRFLGLDIDLVNLRSEEYAENSRIPTEVVSISLFSFNIPFRLSSKEGIWDPIARRAQTGYHDKLAFLQYTHARG